MINFNYETDFKLENPDQLSKWISDTIAEENRKEGEINYIFCSDAYLHKINVEFLQHDTLTDIISFDYTIGKELHGDIYISVERVIENAKDLNITFKDEIARVIIHGILHYCGYIDKTDEDKKLMRSTEDYHLSKRS